MTHKEMHILLLQNLQHLGGFASKGFTSTERSLHLNVGLHRYIKQRYTGNNPRQEGVEDSLKRMADLGGLVSVEDGLTNSGNTTHLANADVFTLPGTFMFYIYSQSALHRNGEQASKWVGNKVVKHEELHEYLENDINNPIIEEPLVLFVGGNMMIIRNTNDSVSDVELFYIKKPTPITDSTSEYVGMPTHTHEEIVELTTAIIKERTERKSYATSLEEIKQME